MITSLKMHAGDQEKFQGFQRPPNSIAMEREDDKVNNFSSFIADQPILFILDVFNCFDVFLILDEFFQEGKNRILFVIVGFSHHILFL